MAQNIRFELMMLSLAHWILYCCTNTTAHVDIDILCQVLVMCIPYKLDHFALPVSGVNVLRVRVHLSVEIGLRDVCNISQSGPNS